MSELNELIYQSAKFDDRKTDFQVLAKHHLEFTGDGCFRVKDVMPQYVGTNGHPVTGSTFTNSCYHLSDNARTQLFAKLGAAHFGRGTNKSLPSEYLAKFDPAMLAEVLNWTLRRSEGRWLVRTYDGTKPEGGGSEYARAILDWGYPRVSNTTLLNITNQALQEKPESYQNFSLVRPFVTPDEVGVRMVWQDLEVQTTETKGGNYRVGAYISNDETGRGKLQFMPLIQRTSCTNSIIMGGTEMHRAGVEFTGFAIHHYSGVTMQALIAQFALNLQPMLNASGEMINRIIVAEAETLEDFTWVMRGLEMQHGWKTSNRMVNALNEGTEGSRSRMAVVNAVTYAAHQVDGLTDGERVEMEQLGGYYLTAPAKEFARLAEQGRKGKLVGAPA